MSDKSTNTTIRTDIPHPRDTIYTRYVKRILDVVLSGLAIIVLSPLLLVLVILEIVFHGHPVFYMDKRPGKDGKIFEMYKFRSMINETEKNGVHLTPAERITPFGRFLRRTSLDELGGLFNIFNGTMSIIGPRPLMVDYLPLYNQRHKYRLSVRPGLACLKIGGTNELSSATWTWNEQFESDIYYVEHVSFWLDVLMVLKIIKIVFSKSETRMNSNRVKFDGKNLLETRTKKQLLEDEKKAANVKSKDVSLM